MCAVSAKGIPISGSPWSLGFGDPQQDSLKLVHEKIMRLDEGSNKLRRLAKKLGFVHGDSGAQRRRS